MDKQTYIGTDATIRQLVRTSIEGDGVRLTFLRILVGTTIKELGAELRTANATGRRVRLSPEEQARQLAAVDAVYGRFSAIIDDEAEKSLADTPAKERAQVKNRRTNFARTAIYTVRRFIKAGKDITALAPSRVSKSAMAADLPVRPPTPRRLKNRLERASKAFMRAVLELSEADQQGAVAELDTLLGQLATQLAALGVEAVKNPTQAVAEHRPLRIGSQLFMPTQTAILRQRQSPS